MKEGITYRTSSVLTSPIVEGTLPVKLFPSNNLVGNKTKVQNTSIFGV